MTWVSGAALRRGVRQAAIALAFASLAACASAPGGGGGPLPAGRINYAADSRLGAGLRAAEIDALYPVFLAAVERGAPGRPQSWAAGATSGSVTPGDYRVGNLKPDPRTLLPVEPGLDLSYRFETELGLYAVTGNANLRAGPSTQARILRVIDAGSAVDAVGRTIGQPFYLVSIAGRVSGYMHESLLRKAPGTELELDGGPTRRAHLCREFLQSLTRMGETERWAGVACDRGQGWRLEPRDPMAARAAF
jgi:uncharacterized protein YgiM (DUF1202 family)